MMKNSGIQPKHRIIYIDLLRIISILSVIVLHITATLLTSTNDFNSASWWVSNLFNSTARFAVPVFFMISGAMILRTEVTSYKVFFKKRIVPLLVSLLSWSLIYSLFTQYYLQKSTMNVWEFLMTFAYNFVMDRSYVHLWFLYAIIAVYLTVPLVSRMIKNCTEKELRYYLILWFTISIAYRFITEMVLRITSENLNIPIMNIPLFMGYLGYFILGYYLFHYEVSVKLKTVLYNLGVVSFFLAPVATYFASMHSGVLDEMFYGNYSITTFFMSAGVFLIFKEKDAAISAKMNNKVRRLVSSISKTSFSIYLIHLLIEIMVSKGAELDGSVIEITLTLLFDLWAVFVVSYVLVKILNLNKLVTEILFGGKS